MNDGMSLSHPRPTTAHLLLFHLLLDLIQTRTEHRITRHFTRRVQSYLAAVFARLGLRYALTLTHRRVTDRMAQPIVVRRTLRTFLLCRRLLTSIDVCRNQAIFDSAVTRPTLLTLSTTMESNAYIDASHRHS